LATDTRPKRLLVAVLLSTLFVSGILIASGVSQILAAELLPLDPSGSGAASTGRVAAAKTKRYDPNPILRRNIFDSVTGDLTATGEATAEEPTEEVAEPTGELDLSATYPTCSGSSRLVGAFVIHNRPEDSFAAVTDASGATLLYQQGMNVTDREVAAIRPQSVIFNDSGRYCQLGILVEEEQVATAPTRPAAQPATPERPNQAGSSGISGISSEELDSNISRISDTQYSVNRSLVDRLITNQAALMRTARVIPHEEGGQVVGVKLYGIRRSSLLGRLGVQNGDMVRTINGFDMTSPDTALQAYARLREADRITINLVRRGQPMTMDYQIR
jgi:general secretion pathway protein C